MALLLGKAKMGPKALKRATAVRFWCSWYPTQYFWIRPVILDRFQGPGRSFSDQKLGLKSKSGFSGHPRYLRPKLRTSDQNALKQTGSEGPQNLSMGFWHVKHQFYLPAQKCSNLTHPSEHTRLKEGKTLCLSLHHKSKQKLNFLLLCIYSCLNLKLPIKPC